MRTITLPRHYWRSFRQVSLPSPRKEAASPPLASDDTKPRAPAPSLEARFWATGKIKLLGIILPNRYQALLMAAFVGGLALPVFLCDTSGHALRDGLITLGGLATIAALFWVIGMLLANTCEESRDLRNKR